MPAQRRRFSSRIYSEEARQRLGQAHRQARLGAGYKSRPQYSQVSGINLRSLNDLENGHVVGQYILEEAGRQMPGWTEGTPLSILDGGEIPAIADSVTPPNRARVPGSNVDPMSSIGLPVGSDAWLQYYSERVPEEDFLEIRAAILRLRRKLAEVEHLVAERDQPHVSR